MITIPLLIVSKIKFLILILRRQHDIIDLRETTKKCQTERHDNRKHLGDPKKILTSRRWQVKSLDGL